jgi:hypothetical protein
MTEHTVVKGLARMAAERALKGLELLAEVYGTAEHPFKPVEGVSHRLVVTFASDDRYRYVMRMPMGGVIDRDTALRMLATDKELRAAE